MPNPTPSPALPVDAIKAAMAPVMWTAGGSTLVSCRSCDGEWKPGAAEQHSSTCGYLRGLAQLTALQQAVADAQQDMERATIIPRAAAAEGCCAVCFEPITLNREMLDGVRKIRLWRTCACDNAPMIFRPSDETMQWLKADAARTPDPAREEKSNA